MEIERDTGAQGLEPQYAKFVSRVTGVPCSNVRIIYLKGFGIRFELLQFFRSGNELPESKSSKVRGYHIAFIVTDIHDAYEKLRQVGMRFVSAPLKIPGGPLKGGFAVYFTDLSGNRIELIEMPKR